MIEFHCPLDEDHFGTDPFDLYKSVILLIVKFTGGLYSIILFVPLRDFPDLIFPGHAGGDHVVQSGTVGGRTVFYPQLDRFHGGRPHVQIRGPQF